MIKYLKTQILSLTEIYSVSSAVEHSQPQVYKFFNKSITQITHDYDIHDTTFLSGFIGAAVVTGLEKQV